MTDQTGILRETVKKILSSGLKTEAFPRADTPEMIAEIIARLREKKGNTEEILKIAGYTLTPVNYGQNLQLCKSCMYFLPNKKWCDLPEINLPAEAKWSCRLWRV